MPKANLPSRPTGLPDYSAPPLKEVAFGLQYERPQNFHELFVSEIWREMFAGFSSPKIIQRTPPLFETFGNVFRDTMRQNINFSASNGPAENRYVFESEDGERTIQVQSDKIVSNWKKRTDRNYPRFESIRDEFVASVTQLENLIQNFEIGEILPTQCQLVYINQVPAAHLSESLALFGVNTFQGVEVEGYASEFSRVITNAHGERTARLFGNIWTTISLENEPIVQLNLHVRGAPEISTLESCWNFYQMARSEIVETFDHIISEEARNLWGKKR